MILDFPVVIQRKTVAVSERGFGTILILDNTKETEFKYITADDLNELESEDKVSKIATRLFMQKPQPQQVAVFGAEGKVDVVLKQALEVNADWFYLVTVDNTAETIKAVSPICQTNNKIYAVTVNDIEVATEVGKEKFDNTFVFYHNDKDSYVAEGLAVIMSYKIGGKTAKFKTIQGVKNSNVTLTQLNALHKANMQSYVEKLGVLQTSEGKMLSGEYIDVVLGEYWIRFRLEEALQRLAVTEEKIPYTDRGIGMLVGETEKVLARAVEQGIVEERQYRVDYKLRKDVPSNEVALRKYNYVLWTAMLQGAIHTGQISGILTYDIVNDEEENR